MVIYFKLTCHWLHRKIYYHCFFFYLFNNYFTANTVLVKLTGRCVKCGCVCDLFEFPVNAKFHQAFAWKFSNLPTIRLTDAVSLQ